MSPARTFRNPPPDYPAPPPPPPPPHNHVWQPVGVQREAEYGTTTWGDWIYALCQCGAARKFPVEVVP